MAIAELHVLYRASISFGFLPVFLALVVSAIAGTALMTIPKRGAFGRARDIWAFGVITRQATACYHRYLWLVFAADPRFFV